MKVMFAKAMNSSASANHWAEAGFTCAFSGRCDARANRNSAIVDTILMVSIFAVLALPLSLLSVSILAAVLLITLIRREARDTPKEHPALV